MNDSLATPTSAPTLARDTWAGRRVLVTGHSGFVGSWLSTTLVMLGAKVTGFSLDGDDDARARAGSLADRGVHGVRGDVRDFDAIRTAMADQPFDAVFHLAGQALVRVGLEQPRTTFATNVGGSVNVLEAARLCRPPVLVHVTSDKCYRNRGWAWPYREVDDLGGGDPYSVSKAAAELVFEGYAGLWRADGLGPRAASVRFGNIIGGGDRANRMVPNAIAACRAGVPVVVHRRHAVRPWQHVLDVVHGLLLLADGLASGRVGGGEVLNFAPPGGGEPVELLARLLIEAWQRAGGQEVPIEEVGERFAEEALLRLDGSKAADALAWTHRFDLAKSAASVVAWHRLVMAGADPADVTAMQVGDFLDVVAGSRAGATLGAAS
ncbi:CDP-glucose 4,6-dehydratase [Saccharothrix deserti]|uniref:CDP-glucose 4,6-dehydratase n=1 Tax=Saccharothrix deserti TaxID=2593674 RepID=UPI00131E9B3F|nr:CDP-glucose 4,6-dehydratase [Saccharothrix deserti]